MKQSSAEIALSTILDAATEHGLAVVGVTDADPLALDRDRLEAWQQAGFHGDMSYMARDPAMLAAPRRVIPWVRSIVSVAAPYSQSNVPIREDGCGRIARYAWGRDYHRALRKRVTRLALHLSESQPALRDSKVVTDSFPLLERALGVRSGLGFIGKNTLLIRPGVGSFFLLAEILLPLSVTLDRAIHRRSGRCGSCSRCLRACPTGAFVAPHVLDARKCISYLTIEKRGALALWERSAIGEWVFGCDVCQEVCPFNHRALSEGREGMQEFARGQGIGPLLSLASTLGVRTQEEFTRRFAGTPLMRARREGLLRNCAIVAANTRAESVVPALTAAIREDVSPVVRSHAFWSLCALSRECNNPSRRSVDALWRFVKQDPSEEVRREAEESMSDW